MSDAQLLLGVGAQRSGSTWLSEVMRKHQDILVTEIKELHFFGNRNHPRNWAYERYLNVYEDSEPKSDTYLNTLRERLDMDGCIEKYKDFFASRNTDNAYFNETSPAYMHLDRKELLYIKAQFPDIKIIFLLRDPIARLWSAIRFDNQKLNEKHLGGFAKRSLDQKNYFVRSDYKSAVQNYDKVFGSENIFYGFYENLFNQMTLDELSNFLGISAFEANFEHAVNAAKFTSIPEDVAIHLRDKLDDQYNFIAKRFEGKVPESWLF